MRNLQKGNEQATDILAALVPRITYKDWTFTLQEVSRGQGCEGLTLVIEATVPDTCNPGETVTFAHLMPVLPANYDERNWTRWVLEQILMVEKHESLEWFRVDDRQAYFPSHAPGENPYAMVEVRTEAEAFADAQPWYSGPPRDPHFR
jgi:hypothetical protein